MIAFNDYLVDVVYRTVYHTQRLVRRLSTGSSKNAREVTSLISLLTMYLHLFEFWLDNDDSFTDTQIRNTCYHVDEILWTKYSTVEQAVVLISTSITRYYGVSSISPVINDTYIDSLITDGKSATEAFYEFSIVSPPTMYCVLAFPSDGIDHSTHQWTDGGLVGYYFQKLQTGYSYTNPSGTIISLDVYLSYYKYGINKRFKIIV